MQYSDSSDLQGIIEDITFRTGADTTQFTTKDRTRIANEAYSKVAFLIIQSDGRMKWDDTNHTDRPVTQFNLVSGQEDYNIFQSAPSALQDWLTIDDVEALDENDNAILLKPIDKKDLSVAFTEYKSTAGTPSEYDFDGTSLIFKPAPSYDKTSGGIIYFQRSPSYFTATDTTKRPGFATIFHSYIPMYVSYVWNSTKKGDFNLKPELQEMEKNIQEFYSKRNKYETPRISPKRQSFR